MWVVPLVSGRGQTYAVNIATARYLETGKAGFGKDLDRIAVYAVFSESENEYRRIPLIEIAVTDLDAKYNTAQFYIDEILKAAESDVRVFRFDSYLAK